MEITRGRPEAAGDLARVSGVKLRVELFSNPTLSWLTFEGERNLGRKGTERKVESCTNPNTPMESESKEREQGQNVKVVKDKVFHPGAEREGGGGVKLGLLRKERESERVH